MSLVVNSIECMQDDEGIYVPSKELVVEFWDIVKVTISNPFIGMSVVCTQSKESLDKVVVHCICDKRSVANRVKESGKYYDPNMCVIITNGASRRK